MATTDRIQLPFYDPNPPFPLPTAAEIEAAPDVSLRYGGRRVVKVGGYLAKFGPGVELIEGENMMFVKRTTSVSLPQVFALYASGKNKYIVIEWIDGQTLLSVWSELSTSQKQSIVRELRSFVDQLRAIPAPGYFGGLYRQSLPGGVFWTHEPEPAINGPFDSDEEFAEALALKYTHDGRLPYRADFYRQHLPRILRGYCPVFTHGDVQRKNLMINIASKDTDEARPVKSSLVILDWEVSGWYPSYWEYCLAYCGLRWDDDWSVLLQEALDPYVLEAAWIQAIRNELWS